MFLFSLHGQRSGCFKVMRGRGLCLQCWVVMTLGVTHVTSPVSICFTLATWQHDATSQTPTHHHNPITLRYPATEDVCLPGYWSSNYNNTRYFATLGTNDWCRHRVICPRTPRVNNRGQETWVTHAVTHGLLLITRHDVIVTLENRNAKSEKITPNRVSEIITYGG